MVYSPYTEFVMAMERVEKRMRLVAKSLADASIPYALVGGNAVAYWVATIDPAATRTTKDVDILVRRSDLDHITEVLEHAGLTREDHLGLTMFLDPAEPSRCSTVHLVWAGEKVKPSYSVAAPTPDQATLDAEGLRVLDIDALVRMKLTSFRPIDQVHIADLISVGLIDNPTRDALSGLLADRLAEIERSID